MGDTKIRSTSDALYLGGGRGVGGDNKIKEFLLQKVTNPKENPSVTSLYCNKSSRSRVPKINH